MRVSLSQLAPEEWDHLLEESGRRFRFSHRGRGAEALARAFDGYEARLYRVRTRDDTDFLLPVVRVRRRVRALSSLEGLPLSWQGTPIRLSGRVGVDHLDAVVAAAGDVGCIHVAGGPLDGMDPDSMGGRRGCWTLGESHLLDLRPGYDTLWTSHFTGACRGSCRKALKSGLEVRREPGREMLASYYSMYVEATKAWGYASPPYPYRLFEVLADDPHAEWVSARLDGRIVAGGVFLRGSDDLFEWSVVMHREFTSLSPVNGLLRWVVEDACRRGIAWLDMGSSAGLPGVAKFKESFGAVRVRYWSYTSGTTMNRVLSFLSRARSGGGPARSGS